MRLTRLARAVAVLVATAGAALWVPAPSHDFYHQLSRTSGMPGDTVLVDLGGAVSRCEVYFATNTNRPAPCHPAGAGFRASIEVPIATPQRTRLEWRVWRSAGGTVVGSEDFMILQVEVTATPAEAKPGEPITVTFAGRPVLDALSCRITWPERIPCPTPSNDPRSPAPSVRFTVPRTAREGLPFSFRWRFAYAFRGDTGVRDGTSTIWIALSPPVFRARTGAPAANPGLPLVVAFSSETTGVTITGCGLVYRGASVRCDGSHIAALPIPPDTRPGTTITVGYELAYTSLRPHEPDNIVNDTLPVRVVADPPRFIASAQPARGPPGTEVTLTLEPAVPGVAIADCIAFFPGDAGGTCQRSADRWLVRTRVPAGARPGATQLRWAIASMTPSGEPGADGGVLPFDVLSAPPPSSPPSAAPVLPATPRARSAPVLVAVTDPEAAEPGERVTVTVEALTPGAGLTGCDVTFGGTRTRCGHATGRWTATLTVPAGARPGDLPLTWRGTSSDGPGSGRVAYRVLPRGRSEDPQFAAVVDPGSARPGGHVALIPQPYAASAAITGCSAAFSPDGVPATCHEAGPGWRADVPVPPGATPGTGSIVWRVAYTTSDDATPRSADGVVTVGVAAPPPAGTPWWRGLLDAGWWVALGGLALVALISTIRLAARRRRARRAARADREDGAGPLPATSVFPVEPAGPPLVTVHDPDAGPRREIRLTVHRGRPVVRLHEEEPP